MGEAKGARSGSPGYVLLVINEEAHVRELLRVAELLLETQDLRPVVFREDRLAGLGEPKVFIERGIEVLTSNKVAAGEAHSQPSTARRKIRNRIAALLGNPVIAN